MKRLKNAHFGQWIDPSGPFSSPSRRAHTGLEGDTVATSAVGQVQWLNRARLSTTVLRGR